MSAHKLSDHKIRALLKNHELKVVLDSPDAAYRFEYYTTTLKDAKTGSPRYVRTYRLLDLGRGGVTQEPWDAFDLDKQTTLILGLLEFGNYKVSKVVSGWTLKCPACGHVMRGNIWQSPPKTCPAPGSPACSQRLDPRGALEETLDDT